MLTATGLLTVVPSAGVEKMTEAASTGVPEL
jgi:hypothetical protein